MSFCWCLCNLFFILVTSLNIVITVPPDYCLTPLNQSDCNMPPKIVFSYYKPGSRCEMETWRGCPTANMFDNEYLCSLHCIFRSRHDEEEFDPCNIPLNRSICGDQKIVFTHEDGYCRQALWGSCPSYNVFDTIDQCIEACNARENETDIPVTTPNIKLEEVFVDIKEILKDVEKEFIMTTESQTEIEFTAEIDSTDEIESTTEIETTTETISEAQSEEQTTAVPMEFTTDDNYEEVLIP